MAESAKAKPNTIAFCGKMVVCSKTPCTSNATPSNARPIVLMPDAFDVRPLCMESAMPAFIPVVMPPAKRPPAGMPASAGSTAVLRCARQPATASPP